MSLRCCLILALLSLLRSFASGLVFIWVSEPSGIDSILDLLSPWLLTQLMIGSPVCLLGAGLAFVLGLPLLRGRRIGPSFAIVFGSVALQLVILTPLVGWFAVPGAFPTLFVALLFCRFPRQLRLEPDGA